jgi:proteasome accessory factor B
MLGADPDLIRIHAHPERRAPMSTEPSKLQRWLDMVAHLAGRRFPITVEQLWEAVPAYQAGLYADDKTKATVRRMFERDKDELKKLGIPLDSIPYSINYGREQLEVYRLSGPDFLLPYLRLVAEARAATPAPAQPDFFPLEPAEARAALDGLAELAEVPASPLRAAARSAFRKLAFDLEPELTGGASTRTSAESDSSASGSSADPPIANGAPVVYAEDPETTAARETLRAMSDAVRRRKAIRFRYRGIERDTEGDRHVHPYGLLFQHGRWYVVGRDVDQDAERMFRAGRMREVREDTPKSPAADFQVPESFDLQAYAGRAAWEVGEDPEGAVEAVVRFSFPRSLWADRNGHGTLISDEPDGSQTRRFTVLRRDPFLRWVLSLAGDARVEEPEPMRAAFSAMVLEVVRRYAEAAASDPAAAGDPAVGAGSAGRTDSADPADPDTVTHTDGTGPATGGDHA